MRTTMVVMMMGSKKSDDAGQRDVSRHGYVAADLPLFTVRRPIALNMSRPFDPANAVGRQSPRPSYACRNRPESSDPSRLPARPALSRQVEAGFRLLDAAWACLRDPERLTNNCLKFRNFARLKQGKVAVPLTFR